MKKDREIKIDMPVQGTRGGKDLTHGKDREIRIDPPVTSTKGGK